MSLGTIFRGVLAASGAILFAAGAMRAKARKQRARPCAPLAPETVLGRGSASGSALRERRDFFSITRSRSKETSPQWVLQGFGRFQCFLLFDSWRAAMDQATFLLENLGPENPRKKDLVQLAGGSISAKTSTAEPWRRTSSPGRP